LFHRRDRSFAADQLRSHPGDLRAVGWRLLATERHELLAGDREQEQSLGNTLAQVLARRESLAEHPDRDDQRDQLDASKCLVSRGARVRMVAGRRREPMR
jgi:hypothetical protein